MLIIPITEEKFIGMLEDAMRKVSSGALQQSFPPPDELLTAVPAADFLSIEPATLYSLVSRKAIPFMKPNNKRLYFSKNELTEWVKNGRKKTATELANDAGNYLRKGPRAKGTRK